MDARWMNDTPTESTLDVVEVLPNARRAVRRAVELPCELVSHYWDAPAELHLGDLSPFGAWIDTEMPLHRGAEVVVSFRPPRCYRELSVFARVTQVRTGRRRADRGRLGMGIEFGKLSDEERSLLAASLRGLPPRLNRGRGRAGRQVGPPGDG
jgi:hypothetical protein